MDRSVKYFKYCYENDTAVEFVDTGLYSMLNVSFTSEDPDYGTDTLHYTSEPAESEEQLAYEMLNEVSRVLNARDNPKEYEISRELKMVYDDYSTSTLIATEHALQEISKNYEPVVRNADVNVIQLITIRNAAKLIKDTCAGNRNVRFDFGVGVCGRKLKDLGKEPQDLIWYGVRLIPNDGNLFDGDGSFETDYIFLCGHWGGGCITMAYYVSDEYMHITEAESSYLCEKMMESCGATNPDEIILLETVEEKKGE